MNQPNRPSPPPPRHLNRTDHYSTNPMHPTEVVVEVEPATREWEEVQTDHGRTYYHNTVTGETSWEPPPGFKHGGKSQGQGQSQGQSKKGGRAQATEVRPGLGPRTTSKQLQRTLFGSLDGPANGPANGATYSDGAAKQSSHKERLPGSYVKAGVRTDVLTNKRPSKPKPASATEI